MSFYFGIFLDDIALNCQLESHSSVDVRSENHFCFVDGFFLVR